MIMNAGVSLCHTLQDSQKISYALLSWLPPFQTICYVWSSLSFPSTPESRIYGPSIILVIRRAEEHFFSVHVWIDEEGRKVGKQIRASSASL